MDSTPTLALASQLIARRSQTPADDGCQDLIRARLEPLGFDCRTIHSNGVTNLWARRGTARPTVCLAGHTDVVPAGPLDAWRFDPYVPTVREGYLYGRGAADMKSSLAAFVTGVEAFVAAHPSHGGSIAFLITSDEEGPAIDGTAHVVGRLTAAGERLDYCIVGEPSSGETLGDTIKNGRRGTLSGTLTVHGVQGHVAYPQLARNPILLAAPAITELAATRWDEGNEHFPATGWQVSNIHAGTGATNVIPGTLELLFNFRYATASTRESLQSRMEEILRRHGLDYRIEWTSWGKPFLTAEGNLVAIARHTIERICGVKAALSCTGGTSDGRFIADICDQVVEIGPVNATIHKIDERVAVSDLEPLSKIYSEMLAALLAPASAPLAMRHP